MVKDCDPNTGLPDSEEGYDDEYMLEDLEITVADQIQKNKKSNFTVAWDSAATESKRSPAKFNSIFLVANLVVVLLSDWVEVEDTYALSAVNTLQEAVNTILKFLGLASANMTEKVAEGVHTHTLLCSGSFRNSHDILVRSKLALSDGVTMQLTVRSTHDEVAELVTSAIG